MDYTPTILMPDHIMRIENIVFIVLGLIFPSNMLPIVPPIKAGMAKTVKFEVSSMPSDAYCIHDSMHPGIIAAWVVINISRRSRKSAGAAAPIVSVSNIPPPAPMMALQSPAAQAAITIGTLIRSVVFVAFIYFSSKCNQERRFATINTKKPRKNPFTKLNKYDIIYYMLWFAEIYRYFSPIYPIYTQLFKIFTFC